MEEILKAVEKIGWASMGELVDETGIVAYQIRQTIKPLLEDGTIIKIGNKRSTRYAIFGTEEPENISVSKTLENAKEKIKEIMEEVRAPVDRKLLRERLETYEAKFVPDLLAMVDEGIVNTNGKARGATYWLVSQEAEGIIDVQAELPKPKAAPAPKKRELAEQELADLPKIVDIGQLIKEGFDSLPIGKDFEILELAKAVVESYPKHDFGSWEVCRKILNLWKKGMLPRLSCSEADEGGRRFLYRLSESEDY